MAGRVVVASDQFSSGGSCGGDPAAKLGFVARLDRLLRRWLPGYSFIRGKRRSPSETSMAGGGGGQQKVRGLRGRRQVNDRKQEVYLDTGIAKSEFCVQLETLLRQKLLQKQQELALEQQEKRSNNPLEHQ
ncbi:hypothetical protein KR084_006465 [Drosophila pseudotakahashii]|nr:hypothetical protein KR084_006465 [Drosophila pseudotakahashii]